MAKQKKKPAEQHQPKSYATGAFEKNIRIEEPDTKKLIKVAKKK